jgi:YD repeat-containing protein
VITTTKFNSRGQTAEVYGPYTNTGTAPTGDFYAPSPVQVDDDHRYVYDGAGRQTADIFEPLGAEKWRTTTSYDADEQMTDPPTGGTPVTKVLDVHGNTLQLLQHLGASTATTSTRATTYTYDAAGNMLTMKDNAGDLWKWSYDLRGNPIVSKNPDKGTTTMTYNLDDQLVTTTDNRGVKTTVDYDKLGREIALYDGDTVDPAKLRASWLYDTKEAGQLTSSTRYSTPGNTSTAFVQEITGYDVHDQPTGTTTTIPSVPGLTDTLAGTYTTAMTYTDDGSLNNKTLPTAFGLPTETVHTSYDRLGHPIGMSGRDSVVGATTYSPYGELLQVTSGTTSGKLAYQTRFYDPGTRRLTRDIVSDQAVAGSISDIAYSFDEAGNVIRAADSGPTKDIQCFTYDNLRQLNQAWTINSGTCATPSPTHVM